MIEKYEKYKSSEVETIGDIPVHWTTLSIRYAAEIFGRIGFRGYTVEDIVDEGSGAISLSPSNINDQQLVLKKKTFISWEKYEESPEIMIEENDVILVKTASVGKVAIVDNLNGYKATINPQLIVFKNINLDSRYFYYTLISDVIQKKIESDTNGGVVGTLTQKSINSYPVIKPSSFEQTKIAEYLDHQTALIDAIIEKKQQLIEKLKEQRQAIINEAVTKGLDPNAPMKDSGVEWLGEIPEHWEVVKLKYIGDSITGITYNPNDTRESGKLVLRSSNIQNGSLRLDNCVYVEKEISKKYTTRVGDILICSRNGSRNLIGKNIKIDDRVAGETWGLL